MIKVGDLEKADKFKTHKQTKIANKKLNDELKPQKPKKVPVKIPKKSNQNISCVPKNNLQSTEA